MADTTIKLPVWRTVFRSYRLIFDNLGFLLTRGWPWFVLTALALAATEWLIPVEDGTVVSWDYILQSLVRSAAMAIFLSPFAVRWHRHVLLAQHAAAMPLLRSVAAYGVTALVIEQAFSAVMYAIMWRFPSDPELISIVPIAAFLLWMIVGLYVWSRITLVLPALALNHDNNVSTIWRATRGNGWRLALSSVLTILPMMALLFFTAMFGAVTQVATPEGKPVEIPPATFPGALLSSMVYVAFAVIALSFLTVAYRSLVLRADAARDANGPQPPAGDGS